MSFIIETDDHTRDKNGTLLPRHLGPFLFRMEAKQWAEEFIEGDGYAIWEVQSPKSLRREG